MKDNSWLTLHRGKNLHRYSEKEYRQIYLTSSDRPFGGVFSLRETTREILLSTPVYLPGEVLE